MSGRRICVVTGSRAEYGLLRWLMTDLKNYPAVQLQILATGGHLTPEFGLTWREIVADGFLIDRRIDMLLQSDTGVGIAKSTGLGMIGIADALADLTPDMVVVLGDRFEILAAAAAALLMRIPIIHLHGGELTEGAIDDAIRHAISKMAAVHFTAANEYRNRLLQMGESEDRVFNVGGLGVDALLRSPLMSRSELEASLDFKFGNRNLMVTFHPATAEDGDPTEQCQELLYALDQFPDIKVIITLPNADASSFAIADLLRQYRERNPGRVAVFQSLGSQRYLSCLRYVDGVIGNSSSGLLEAPSFRIGTINIGSRQKGRLRASSVIDCLPQRASISAAIHHLYGPEFQTLLQTVRSPYGEGGASSQIAQILATIPLALLANKSFHDRDVLSSETKRQ